VDPKHYFWVRPIDDPRGECFDTLEEAIAEAQKEMELEAVYPLSGPIVVVEVRGSEERVVWSATPHEEQLAPRRSAIQAPSRPGREPGPTSTFFNVFVVGMADLEVDLVQFEKGRP
jgi:hypothetical protein